MQKIAMLERISFKDIFFIIMASLITAVSIQFIIVPMQLLTGGLSGIAIILHFIFSYPIWLWYVILNIPVFIAGYRLVSTRFALYSFIGMISLSFFLALLEPLPSGLYLDDILLSALLGGIGNGTGVGLALRYRGSTGGMDIIAAILHKKHGISFSATIFICNVLVIMVGAVGTSIELALYSAITIFVSSKIVDKVTSGFLARKTVIIISKNYEAIAKAILHNMHRGCTFLSGSGAYTGRPENIIMVTTSTTQIPRLKELVFALDPSAFLTIMDAVEVYGRGFKPWDKDDV
jgi:uncharacterized membrane-anchored protein YitT (DUF2179 family)